MLWQHNETRFNVFCQVHYVSLCDCMAAVYVERKLAIRKLKFCNEYKAAMSNVVYFLG